jgi:excisionase family DNA binding protein
MPAGQTAHDLVRDGLTSVKEAVAFLRISQALLYKLMGDGRLPYVKIGRARRIPRNALVELEAANRQH